MPHLLILDDDEDSNLLFHVILGGHFHVSTFTCIEEALITLQETTPDLIFLDPKMTNTLNEIRKMTNLKQIPIIALSKDNLIPNPKFEISISKPINDCDMLFKCVESALCVSKV